MQLMRFALLGVGLLAALTLALQSLRGAAVGSPTQQVSLQVNFLYAVKFICGSLPDPGLPVADIRKEPAVKPGNYATAINMHNPNASGDLTVNNTFSQKFVTTEPSQVVTARSPVAVTEDRAHEIDCFIIGTKLFNQFGLSTPFAKGFVILESPFELDVVAVYTYRDAKIDIVARDKILYRWSLAHATPKATRGALVNALSAIGVREEAPSVVVTPALATSQDPSMPELRDPERDVKDALVLKLRAAGFDTLIGDFLAFSLITVVSDEFGVGKGVGIGASIDVEYIAARPINRVIQFQ